MSPSLFLKNLFPISFSIHSLSLHSHSHSQNSNSNSNSLPLSQSSTASSSSAASDDSFSIKLSFNPLIHSTRLSQPNQIHNQNQNQIHNHNQLLFSSQLASHLYLSNINLLLPALFLASTASDLLLARLVSRLTHLSIATFPALEFLALSIIPSLPSNLLVPLHQLHPSQPSPPSNSSSLSFALPLALLSLLASCSRAELAARVGLGAWQAFDVYALPLAIVVVARQPALRQASKELHLAAALLACAISLVLLNQTVSPLVVALGALAPAAHALYLLLLRAWLHTMPAQPPLRALARTAPLCLLLVLLPALLSSAHRTRVAGLAALGQLPRLSATTGLWLLFYLLTRALERLLELAALTKLRSPLAVLLLPAPRNLLSLALAGLAQVYVGLTGLSQIVAIYALAIIGLCGADDALPDALAAPSPPLSPHGTGVHTVTGADEEELEIGREKCVGRLRPGEEVEALLRRRELCASGARRLTGSWRRTLQLIAFGPLLLLFLLRLLGGPLAGTQGAARALHATRAPGTLDVVFSYYNEPLREFADVVAYVRGVRAFRGQQMRVVVYVKHPDVALGEVALAAGADEVVRLRNVGREGGTYLTHILRHYNASLVPLATHDSSNIDSNLTTLNKPEFGTEHLLRSPVLYGLSDHTIFMQPDISWHWIAKPRMELFDPSRSGFLSFGPYLTSICGQDGMGNGNYERMRDIYAIFYHSFCPPTGQLASYAGQFLVSRQRILSNSYTQYLNMRLLLEAPLRHWIHEEGNWLKWKGATDVGPAKKVGGPEAPFLGHALERSWPVVFGCSDSSIVERCEEGNMLSEECQCFDVGG